MEIEYKSNYRYYKIPKKFKIPTPKKILNPNLKKIILFGIWVLLFSWRLVFWILDLFFSHHLGIGPKLEKKQN